jgi:hypothetical protein
VILGGIAAGVALAWPDSASELRDLCADRPGLDTPPCTVDRGHLQVETGVGDWTLEKDAAEETHRVLVADTQLRYGVTDAIEARLGWTPFGFVRSRDRLTGEIDRSSGVGDLTLGLKANLLNPDGKGLSIALLPSVSAPIGKRPIGTGDWGAGLLVPLTYDLTSRVQLDLTPGVDAAVDEDGNGRHLAFGSEAGLALAVSNDVTLDGELAAVRDQDPDGHHTQTLAGVSAAWQLGADWQLDLGSAFGLNRYSPDVEVYAGIVKRF